MSPSPIELIAALVFAASLLHVFSAGRILAASEALAPERARLRRLLHWLGEPELVFAYWSVFLLAAIAAAAGPIAAFEYAKSREFGEPIFVFAAVAIAGSRPILGVARAIIQGAARVAPAAPSAFYISCLVVGPLLGSLVTEPAAMTVTALLLRDWFASPAASARFRYITLATLFVNVSVGGALTSFAAPPILMVAKTWGWTTPSIFAAFGWKAVVAVALNACGAAWFLRADIARMRAAVDSAPNRARGGVPWSAAALNLAALAIAVLGASLHRPALFVGAVAVVILAARRAPQAHGRLPLREGAMVGIFLAGLVVLGGLQSWWLAPILGRLEAAALFVGSVALTAIVDNAALTYLGAQIPGLPESAREALVAGAIAGGGLTLVANAPNPAGYSILRDAFGDEGVGFLRLFACALAPTLVAMACLWFLANI